MAEKQFLCALHSLEKTSKTYESKVKEIKPTLAMQMKLPLTPISRITILKTLIISKLNHFFLVSPKPNENIIQLYMELQSTIDKIKWSIVAQEYLDGSLKMISLTNSIAALVELNVILENTVCKIASNVQLEPGYINTYVMC